MFSKMINGDSLTNGIKCVGKYSNVIRKLYKEKCGIYNKPLPQYMVNLFHHICDSEWNVIIDTKLLNSHFLYDLNKVWNYPDKSNECHGYIKWKNLFFDQNENIKLKQINKIFKNATQISIQAIEPVPNKLNFYRCLPSYLLSSSMLNNLLNLLLSSECKWNQFVVYNPKNDQNSLNELIEKHETNFLNQHYEIGTITHSPNSSFEKCKCFYIVSIK